MRRLSRVILIALIPCVGCSRQSPSSKVSAVVQAPAPASPLKAQVQPGQARFAPQGGGPAAAGEDEPAAQAREKIDRKIKYTAEVRVIADDFDKAEAGLKAALKQAQGIVAMSEVSGAAGSRQGTWRLRVPIANFDSFREAVLKLGEVERNTSDSEDVTEEYYDLQAHIKNRQAEEEALRQLLEKSANNMESFLAIRREMNQVRDDINRKQGRLKLLANLTDLTTVTFGMRERQKYIAEQPPAVAETPTFAMRAGKTFNESWQGLKAAGEFLVLCAIGAAPWLPVLLFAVVVVRWGWHRARRGRPALAPAVEQTS